MSRVNSVYVKLGYSRKGEDAQANNLEYLWRGNMVQTALEQKL